MPRIGLAVILALGIVLGLLVVEVQLEILSASAEAPALPPLEIVLGSQPFSEEQLLSGAFASRETCSRAPGTFWVVHDGRGDCIRTYQSGFTDGANHRVIIFFHGDLVQGNRGKTPVTLVDPAYVRSTPG